MKQEDKYNSHPHVQMMRKSKVGEKNDAGFVKYILKMHVASYQMN